MTATRSVVVASMGRAIDSARALGRQSPQAGHFGAEFSTNLRQQEHRDRYQRCLVILTSIFYHTVARTGREKPGRSHNEFCIAGFSVVYRFIPRRKLRLISIFAAKTKMFVKGKDRGNGGFRRKDRQVEVKVAGCPFLIHSKASLFDKAPASRIVQRFPAFQQIASRSGFS